jgi:hypothetical protein
MPVQREWAQAMDELTQDRWGRILFGLKLSMAHHAVLTLDTSRREEKPASFVPFRRQKFQARRVRGPT